MLALACRNPHIVRITVRVNDEVASFLNNKKRREVMLMEDTGSMTVQILGSDSPLLGHEPAAKPREFARTIASGELVILTTPGVQPAGDLEAWSREVARVARKFRKLKDIAAALREHFGDTIGSVVIVRKK